jgi:dTDP-glucose 4,6-dehydratase
MKSILITGGAGFIGSNFVPYMIETYEQYTFINLDLLTYAGNLDNLKEVENHPRYQFVKGDICNRELVEHLFTHYDIKGVLHFAAESHVDNSISDPSAFIRTNVNGTFTLLDVARKYWMNKPFEFKKDYEECRFLHVSTDEVYGELGETGFFTEQTPYAPNSPYSAAKASSDMIVRSYHQTFGMNVVTTNCSNNFGAKQHTEKLIPVIIGKALKQEQIPIYGDGKNIRDWLYVLDHCRGIDAVFHKGKSGEMYNIGSRNEQDNISLAKTICTVLDGIRPLEEGKSYQDLITFVKDRPGHDQRYAIDPTKLETELGWSALHDFPTALKFTIEWYIGFYEKDKKATEPQKTETTSKNETKQDETTYTNISSSKFNATDLHGSLEELAQIKASIIRTNKKYEHHIEKAKQWESKAILLMQRSKNGEMQWETANELAMELLKEQEKEKQAAELLIKQLSELKYLQSQMEDIVKGFKNARDSYRKKIVEMPDSSDTIEMIERMKGKIDKEEVLAELYKDMHLKKQQEAILEAKVNKVLDVDKKQKALDDLKSKMGIDKD